MSLEKEQLFRLRAEADLRAAEFKRRQAEESLLAEERRGEALLGKVSEAALRERLGKKKAEAESINEEIRELENELERRDDVGHV